VTHIHTRAVVYLSEIKNLIAMSNEACICANPLTFLSCSLSLESFLGAFRKGADVVTMRLEPLSLLSGLQLVGLDGLVLLATLAVVLLVVVGMPEWRPRQPEDDAFAQTLRESLNADVRPVAPAAQFSAQVSPSPRVGGSRPRYTGPRLARPRRIEYAPDHLGRPRRVREFDAARLLSRLGVLVIPISAIALVLGGLLVYTGQRGLLESPVTNGTYRTWMTGLFILAVCVQFAARPGDDLSRPREIAGSTARPWNRRRVISAVALLGASALIWSDGQQRAITDASLDLPRRPAVVPPAPARPCGDRRRFRPRAHPARLRSHREPVGDVRR
jgi:hypothetical protein